MAKDLTKKHLAAWSGLLAASTHVTQRIERELEQAKMVSMSGFEVLAALAEAKGKRMRLSEVADEIMMSRSGLTRLLDRLEQKGYLKREACDNDRRGSYAVLTSGGSKALDAARPVYEKGVEKHFARHLSSSNAKQLDELLDAFLEAAVGED